MASMFRAICFPSISTKVNLSSTRTFATNTKDFGNAIRPVVRELVRRVHPDVLASQPDTIRAQNERSLKDLFALVDSTTARKSGNERREELPETITLHFHSLGKTSDVLASSKQTVKVPVFINNEVVKTSDAWLCWEHDLLHSLVNLCRKVTGTAPIIPKLERHEEAIIRQHKTLTSKRARSARQKQRAERRKQRTNLRNKQKPEEATGNHPAVAAAAAKLRSQMEFAREDRLAWEQNIDLEVAKWAELFGVQEGELSATEHHVSQLLKENRIRFAEGYTNPAVVTLAMKSLLISLCSEKFRKITRRLATEPQIQSIVLELHDTATGYEWITVTMPYRIRIPIDYVEDRMLDHIRHCCADLKKIRHSRNNW